MKRFLWLIPCAAIACGLLAAYVDFHNDEPQPPLLIILTSAFVLGILCARFAWVPASIIVFAFALAHWAGPYLHLYPRYPMEGGPWWSLFVLTIPAGLSAYAGAGVFSGISRRSN